MLYAGKSMDFRLLSPEEREFRRDWTNGLKREDLRYFDGEELARLFGFSCEFSFPDGCTAKQKWKLMGNSLNVGVGGRLSLLGLLLCGYS